jgi:hypothetical protein
MNKLRTKAPAMAAAIIIPKWTAPANDETARLRNAATEVRKLMNIGTPQPRTTASARRRQDAADE